MTFDPKEEFARLQQVYKDDERQSSFNVLLLGESGSGKTFLARTARKPVHIDSFDPGGSTSVRDLITSGDIVVDSQYESEDPTSPHAFPKWKKEFDYRVKNGYFDHIGTYIIDSSTTWSEAIMNSILKKAGISGQAPRFTKDYVPQKIEIRNYLRKCLDLPCDFILTGHAEAKDDIDEQGRSIIKFRFMTTGKGVTTIPLLFDEQYFLITRRSSKGPEYKMVVQNDGIYPARSRLAGNNKLNPLEDPDIKKLLKKVGFPAEDKPKLI